MKLTLSVTDMKLIKWYIDASHRTHADCKGHRGAAMTLGEGAAVARSDGIKINTRSSTEDELVGMDQSLTDVLWTRNFIESLGFTVDQNIIFQDNQSTIRLALNGRLSSSKRTKHIDARYFFIKDVLDRGLASIEYCPTEMMWSDVLNKPKQGSPFRKDRSLLMNVPIDYCDIKERAQTHPALLAHEAIAS